MKIPPFFLGATVLAVLSVGATRLSAQSTTGNISGRVTGAQGRAYR